MKILIEEVRKRNILWDRTNTKYKDHKAVIDLEWRKVSKKLGISKEDAKKKWRNLRDQFIKEFKKIPSGTSSRKYLAKYPGKWQYFESLLFLGHTITLNDTEGQKPTMPELIREHDESQSSFEEGKQDVKYMNNSIAALSRDSPKIEVLINEVRKTNMLWDKTNLIYKDKLAADYEWNRVANKCGLLKEHAKKKWRNLRDQFMKEYKTIPTEAARDPEKCIANYAGKWQHFKSLLFLRGIAIPKGPQQNKSTYHEMALLEELIEFPNSHEENNAEENYMDEWTVDETEAPTYSSKVANRLSKKMIVHNSENDDIESKKLKLLEPEENENLLFFKSLLPYFEKLNTIQQLRVRSKFQNILIEEIENN